MDFKFPLTFLLCLNLLILSILLPLKYTLFNEEYMKQELIRQNYDTKVYEEIKTQMNHYLIQSGLDESVFDNIITEEKIKEDITNNLTSLYTYNYHHKAPEFCLTGYMNEARLYH